ncbi:class I SAM-dependent methyltransferase [Pseudomonas sp. yb_2]|uniref:class I SAM-dependent methyltransferase n=1 Tax=Pseudomonas sp. yb_2 TaxID=3367218 RepID=UPI00370B2A29
MEHARADAHPYPSELAAHLASLVPGHFLAVDVGCGTGQLTRLLADHFQTVAGFDPSADQIANASPLSNIHYGCALAEDLPLLSRSASLITAAQAAHWFDLPRFYSEVRRISEPGAILALISYGVLKLEGQLNERFKDFYWREIGSYWPAERKLVDSGYATIAFPFTEMTTPDLSIRLEWSLPEFLGYISTWSAVRSAKQSGRIDLLETFATEMAELWGDSAQRHRVTWPINMRTGRI